MLTRDKELWAVALWVEKQQGPDGPRYIAEQIGRPALEGDQAGVDTLALDRRTIRSAYEKIRLIGPVAWGFLWGTMVP